MTTDGTQFEILNRVDVGGMAEIFRARNIQTGEIMAIKRILPSLVGQAEFVNMFIDEAAICLALHHPNIVRVDQIGRMDNALFMSMEYIDGTNLREVLNFANQYNYFLPIHEAVRIAVAVLDGLDYAHALCGENGEPLNLIHRDISPPNILISYHGDVKITDFGLVKSKAQLTRTVPGLIKGKFSYLSPEAAYGESIDHRSDIYAVGIVLWEMLTSRPLFVDPVEMKILDLVRKSIVPPIAQFNPSVPAALEKIILKGLARDRAKRYQTAKEFAGDLRSFLASIGNPPSDLGRIIESIKPRKIDPEDESRPAPPKATAHDDEVQPHTRSELIPIEKLQQQAAESEKKEQNGIAESEQQNGVHDNARQENDPPKANSTVSDPIPPSSHRRSELKRQNDKLRTIFTALVILCFIIIIAIFLRLIL